MIEATGISFVVGQKRILDDVSVCVRPREVLAVVGPNGSGKSTLVKILSGELLPTTGSVRMNDRDLLDGSSRQRARQVAVLSQHSHLDFGFSVEEVVSMGRTPHETPRQDRSIVWDAMACAGVAGLADRLYPTLSGGEKQRVHLARVLAQLEGEGQYLLLDEPVASLDLKYQHAVMHVAQSLSAKGIGVLTVMHELRLARRYATRVLVMNDGIIVANGPTSEVITIPAIAKTYEVHTSLAAEAI